MSTETANLFLEQHPSITAIDLLMVDTSGVLRGKRVGAASLETVFREGIRLPCSTFSMDVNGNIVYDTGFILETGEADFNCMPIANTLATSPWARDAAQVLITMVEADGQPFFADPRGVLARVLNRLEVRGLYPCVAVELEFYLLDREMGEAGPQPARSQLTRRRSNQTGVYAISELEDFSPVLTDITEACAQQGIATHTLVAESSPGHYEINLTHQTNGLAAADHAVMFKRVVKSLAIQHGIDATFMAKPFTGRSGSGMHIHVSLMDEAGNNVFQAEDNRSSGSETLGWAIGGLCQTMAESMAIFAPNSNSFRRYREGAFVPVAPCWGINNRTTALRIPLGDPQATRFEHRVPGADANIYLTLAAILAGLDYGLEHQLQPPALTEGNAYDQYRSSLPRTWREALTQFDQGTILKEYFGKDYCHVYSRCKWAEQAQVAGTVTPLEHDWYLYAV
jgi:glutamine synthetase